jgi:MoaA/NifB/PqqE/SkfB family radical SAM enzyme
MLDQTLLKEYNEFRGDASLHTLCPAPSMNLHFSQLGVVTACCFNRKQVMGVYPTNSLEEIWTSDVANKMREELKSGFPKGCEKCREQIISRDFGGSHANFYSQQAKHFAFKRGEKSDGILPMKLEFNIHNNCNLQCVMCHGLASSSIRIQREGLSAMPNPYDEQFVEQLKEFLPHVVETDFMGGEPFMIGTYQRIWKAISEVNPTIKTCILTNATILNDSIKSLLESFNCWIHISIDSFKKSTYEKIRKGASFETVMENSAYFNHLMKARGMNLVWRYCPMRLNWHELPETVEYCTNEGIKLFFNQVDSPIHLSLTTLPVDELTHVIETLKAEEPELPKSSLALENLKNYRELIHRLSGYLKEANRSIALQSRLQASEAVVSHYTPERERSLSKRNNSNELHEQFSLLFRGYFINRLNIEQANNVKTKVEPSALELMLNSREALLSKTENISFEEFVEIYLKELVRVVSGVWGVTRVHDRSIFGIIDEFVAAIPSQSERNSLDRNGLLELSLLRTYEEVAFSKSSEEISIWMNELTVLN